MPSYFDVTSFAFEAVDICFERLFIYLAVFGGSCVVTRLGNGGGNVYRPSVDGRISSN